MIWRASESILFTLFGNVKMYIALFGNIKIYIWEGLHERKIESFFLKTNRFFSLIFPNIDHSLKDNYRLK